MTLQVELRPRPDTLSLQMNKDMEVSQNDPLSSENRFTCYEQQLMEAIQDLSKLLAITSRVSFLYRILLLMFCIELLRQKGIVSGSETTSASVLDTQTAASGRSRGPSLEVHGPSREPLSLWDYKLWDMYLLRATHSI